MANILGMTVEEARQLIERSAIKVLELPREAREEGLTVVEGAFRQMYVVSGAGEEQIREAVEILIKGVRALLAEVDAAGPNGRNGNNA
jgi:hypothetical protein